MTLIRAETEGYDIVGFSKATTKSLTSKTGSKKSNFQVNVDPLNLFKKTGIHVYILQ